jgi:hypothetical protein
MTGATPHIGHKPDPTCIVFQAGVVETFFGGKSEAIRQNTVQMAVAGMTASRTKQAKCSSDAKDPKREQISCVDELPLTARAGSSNSDFTYSIKQTHSF